jgi:hypothetical protein
MRINLGYLGLRQYINSHVRILDVSQMSPLRGFRSPFQDLPFDVLAPVLSQLTDSRDWHACALVNKSFCRVATPLLYRTLDSRVISKVSL